MKRNVKLYVLSIDTNQEDMEAYMHDLANGYSVEIALPDGVGNIHYTLIKEDEEQAWKN